MPGTNKTTLTEGRLSAIVEAAADAIITIDQQGLIQFCNPAVTTMFGYEPVELIGKNIKVLMPEPYASAHDGYLSNYLLTGIRKIISIGREVSGRKKDGTIFPVHLAVSEVVLKHERLFTGIVRDISDRIKAENELRVSEHRNRTLIENAPCSIYELDMQGNVLSMNAMGLQVHGVTSMSEISGVPYLSLIGDVHKECLETVLDEARSGKSAKREFEFNFKHCTHFFSSSFTPVKDEFGTFQKIIVISEDVTDRIETEKREQEHRAQLIHAEKMAALGEMAAGIAHELGTPIATIRGRMELLEKQLTGRTADKENIARVANTIKNEADRMTRIIRGILSFSRDGSEDPFRTERIHPLISDILEFSTEQFRKHGIEVCIGNIPGTLEIECRGTQIAQTLVNLLSNARDAVRKCEERWIRVDAADLGEHVEISVTDSGTGVPLELQNSIMEPFFTTKPAGVGTGLGLSISQSIAQAHGGRLWLDPKSEHTRFVLSLPKLQAGSQAHRYQKTSSSFIRKPESRLEQHGPPT